MSGSGEVRWEELKPVLRLINDRMDHIERWLVKDGYKPFNPDGPPPPSEQVIELARAGKTLDAIKLYRSESNADLEEARAKVLAI
jgi:hypothetical protein